MIVLIDTDVLIDVALDRRPFSNPAGRLLDACKKGEARAMWRGIRFPPSTTGWFLRKARREPKGFIRDLLRFVGVSLAGTRDVLYAIRLPMGRL
jgi:hypothetical protein